MYKVLKHFNDIQDNGYSYNVGDIYPRASVSPSAERIKELSGNKNRQGTPLIKKIPQPKKAKSESNT